MFERLCKFGCGVSLIFGGAARYGAADALFQKILSVMLFFGAIAFCGVMLAQAAAEDRVERPVAEDVRRVKIKEGSRKVRRTFWEEGAAAGKGADPAEQAGQAKRRDATWVRKYYDGEFDPEDDPSQSASQTALPKGRACETAPAASKIKKFVL